MKIKSINCKHTVDKGNIAVNLDEKINQDIVKRLNPENSSTWHFAMVSDDATVLKIKIGPRKETHKGASVVDKEDIKKTNNYLLQIKADIKQEESANKARCKGMLEEIAGTTGLPLDCEE